MSSFCVKIILPILLILLLYNCQNEEDLVIQIEDCYVQEISQSPYWEPEDSTAWPLYPDTFTNIYEDDLLIGRLRNGNAYEEYKYNDNDLLVEISKYSVNGGEWYISDSLYYDEEGRLLKRELFSKLTGLSREESFFWDNEHLLYVITEGTSFNNGDAYSYRYENEFIYLNGNIVQEIRTSTTSISENIIKVKLKYEYDTKENIRKKLRLADLGVIFRFSSRYCPYWFSKNNLVREDRYTIDDFWIGGREIDYSWEGNKVISFTERNYSTMDDHIFVRPVFFHYECE